VVEGGFFWHMNMSGVQEESPIRRKTAIKYDGEYVKKGDEEEAIFLQPNMMHSLNHEATVSGSKLGHDSLPYYDNGKPWEAGTFLH